jgi:hypothetical protein
MLPKIAAGDANKLWIVPSEIGKALEGLGSTLTDLKGIPANSGGPAKRVDLGPTEPSVSAPDRALSEADAAVQEAIAEANASVNGIREQTPSLSPEQPTGDPLNDPLSGPLDDDPSDPS